MSVIASASLDNSGCKSQLRPWTTPLCQQSYQFKLRNSNGNQTEKKKKMGTKPEDLGWKVAI